MLSFEKINNQITFILNNLNSGCVECDKKTKEFYESVEKVSMVLDIVLSKKVDIYVLQFSDNEQNYNDMVDSTRKLTKGQFKAIKEIL